MRLCVYVCVRARVCVRACASVRVRVHGMYMLIGIVSASW